MLLSLTSMIIFWKELKNSSFSSFFTISYFLGIFNDSIIFRDFSGFYFVGLPYVLRFFMYLFISKKIHFQAFLDNPYVLGIFIFPAC